MGLLDDAIREHLDLKRRHGADPAEVERAEREALGPVRRKGDVATADYPDEPDGAFDADGDEAPVGSGPAAYDQAEEHDWEYGDDEFAVPEAEPDPTPPRRTRRAAAQDDEHDHPRGLAARFGLRGRRTEEDEDLEPEPDELESDEPAAADEAATRVHRKDARAGGSAPPTDDETAEHQIAGAHDADVEDEDVLEETPEFLQDTPEHDRLWFEQRPPRDFDFDG